jgi:antitoxin (DNA-binding transcriptional repressor) of toxin-antitoxin stability system
MKAVKIAELKSHLSAHLRAVRAGESLTVLDRTTPVAQLVPVPSDDDVIITRPRKGVGPVGRLALPRGKKVSVDVVAMLLQDRRRR